MILFIQVIINKGVYIIMITYRNEGGKVIPQPYNKLNNRYINNTGGDKL